MNFLPVVTIYKKIAPWAIPVLALFLLFSLKTCQKYSGTVDQYARNLDSVAKTAHNFENALGQSVAENSQIQVKSAADLQKMTDTIFNLKKSDAQKTAKVVEYARILQEFKIKDKMATWDQDTTTDTLTRAETIAGLGPVSGDSSRIHVPRRFSYTDSTIGIEGTVLIQGVHIDSISIPNRIDYRVITQKTGFLHLGRKYTVQVLNSNPAVRTIGVTSIAVPPTLTWWQRIGKPVAFAILAAVIVSTVK